MTIGMRTCQRKSDMMVRCAFRNADRWHAPITRGAQFLARDTAPISMQHARHSDVW
jgi:hypothetical protein